MSNVGLNLFLLLSNLFFLCASGQIIINNTIGSNDLLVQNNPSQSSFVKEQNQDDNAPTIAKAVINTNILTVFTYDDNRVYVYESKSNENAPANKWLFFYLPVMSPMQMPNHDRWVVAVGNEVRLRLMLGNEIVEDLARRAILRKYSATESDESSQYWDVVPLIIETLMAYVVQGSSSPVSGIEPYRAIHPNSLYLTFRFHCTTKKRAIDVAEKLFNGDYEIEIAFYFGGIREAQANFVSITGDQLKSVLSKTTADGGNTNATYIHRNQASKYVGRYVANVKKMMYIENPNTNISQMTDGLDDQFTALLQQAMENSKETIIEADTFGQMWSPYDLNPDRITEELSKIFTYNETETERHNDTKLYYNFNKGDMNEYANSHSAKGGASMSAEAHLSIPFGSGGAKTSISAYGESADSSSGSLLNQLNQTSNEMFTSDDIQRMFTQQSTELEFKGEKIRPKSFKVYKLAELTDQVQVGIISKQLIAEKKDGAIVRTISALNFPQVLTLNISHESTSTTTTSTTFTTEEPRSNTILTGEIRLYSGEESLLPSPWLVCNGSAVSRREFSNLFRVIGESYGNGDGSTTFNLPDFRGRVAIGVDKFSKRVNMAEKCGREGGVSNRSLSIDQLPKHSHRHGSLSTMPSGNHTHSITDPGHNHGGFTGDGGFLNGKGDYYIHQKGSAIGYGDHQHKIETDYTNIKINSAGDHIHSIDGETDFVGKGTELSVMQPFQTINYIIYPL